MRTLNGTMMTTRLTMRMTRTKTTVRTKTILDFKQSFIWPTASKTLKCFLNGFEPGQYSYCVV